MSRLLKSIGSRANVLVLPLAVFFCNFGAVCAQTPTTNQSWAYQLVYDGTLLDDCLLCDRPTILVPVRGTFNLRLLQETPLASSYAVEDIAFKAGNRPYRVKGTGLLVIGGEVAVTIQMSLTLQIDDGFTNQLCYFTNTTTTLDRLWPMLDVTVSQTNGTFTRLYTLRIAAAPVRETWFSTTDNFVPIAGDEAGGYIENGDLISTAGRVVKRNSDLFTSVGAYPPAPDLGLDAVDMLPGGEIAFSLGANITSQTLGPLHHGDLLSNRGRILYRNQELLAAFNPNPVTNDAGLDAVHVLGSGEVLFSIATNVLSEKLSATLQRGDLLSNTGTIVRSNQQLLAAFNPVKPSSDYGLDAFYFWPSGEIWFSTEDSFQDENLGTIAGGDLLSDQGYIVFRNADLVSAFAPTNAPPDLGLDALYVITDDLPPPPGPGTVVTLATDVASSSAMLTWQGQGRVFQLERADMLAGPYQPLSPIFPDLSFADAGALTNRSQSFYRLRQW
jgi:hypothetical protein